MNINSYINETKSLTFDEVPFNEVDSLILSELSYMNLDLITPSIHHPHKRLVKIKDLDLSNFNSIAFGSVDAKQNKRMLKLMRKSNRYMDIEVGYTHRIFDAKTANQFFALTFVLPNGVSYIAYRGTDITAVGWKEDFMMTFKSSILSQKEALEYFKCVIKYIKGDFYIGGHSKGGNLAMYVTLNMPNKYLSRLIKSYSFDGPGFKEGVKNSERLYEKGVKYMTYNDVIGIVYNNFENPIVVDSTGIVLGGHDPFYWKVDIKNHSFIYKKERSSLSKKSEQTFVNWVNDVSNDDMSLAVEAFFKVFYRVHTIYDLLKYGIPDIIARNKVLCHYNEEEQKRIKSILNKLITYIKLAFLPKKKKIKQITKQD